MEVYHLKLFDPLETGHGGERRSTQIKELFENVGVQLTELDFNKPLKRTYFEKFKFLKRSYQLCKDKAERSGFKQRVKDVLEVNYWLFYLNKELSNSNKDEKRLLIWENTWPDYWFIPIVAKEFKFRIIAFPHNLESLVPGQSWIKNKKIKSPQWLMNEVGYLKEVDQLFCISREEQWLMSLFMAPNKVTYYPYKIPNEVLKSLNKIKSERISNPSFQKVLILGSARNLPTRLGMITIKEFIKTRGYSGEEFEFIGYGAHLILEDGEILPDNVEITSDAPQSYLEDGLTKAKCVVIYQAPTSGALTRISEMMQVGVPVLVNYCGAKSFFNMKGVYVFERIEDLDELILNIDELDSPDEFIDINNFELKVEGLIKREFL